MPLSEEEQRILQDIERSFYETDPAFARAVEASSLHRHAGRNCKLAAIGFILSLVLLLATFTRLPVLGFTGFLGMVSSAFVFVQNLRRAGGSSVTASGLRQGVSAASTQRLDRLAERWRDKFKREG